MVLEPEPLELRGLGADSRDDLRMQFRHSSQVLEGQPQSWEFPKSGTLIPSLDARILVTKKGSIVLLKPQTRNSHKTSENSWSLDKLFLKHDKCKMRPYYRGLNIV